MTYMPESSSKSLGVCSRAAPRLNWRLESHDQLRPAGAGAGIQSEYAS
jgi:hypothetical protein